MIAPTRMQQDTPQTLAQMPMSQADAERKEEMKAAWKAYRGKFQPPLKVRANQPDDNVLSNRCAPVVDKGVSFLFGKTLKIECMDEVGDTDEAGEPEAKKQALVDGLWGDDDKKMTRLSKLGVNGGVCGQTFVKLIPATGKMKYPRLVVMDPQIVRIVTDPDDCDIVLAYVIEYPGSNDYQKRQIVARVDPDGELEQWGGNDPDDTWTITNYIRKGQAGSWMQTGERIEWPYPFPPIFTRQNLPNPNEPWGMPDLPHDLINMNKVLNFVQSNTSRIIKYHGHPKTWGRGFRASQVNQGIEDILIIEAPDGILQNLEMHSDLQSSLRFAETLRGDMDEQSRVPAVALGRLESLPKGNISGVALQLLFQPLIEKTTQKQRLYGDLIREVTRAALVLAGLLSIEEYEDYPVEIHWQNLLPVDDLAAAQTALLLKQIGISDSTVMQELGYNADDEADKSADEDAKKLTRFSRGQGLPPAQPQPPGAPGQQPPGQPGQQAPEQQPPAGVPAVAGGKA